MFSYFFHNSKNWNKNKNKITSTNSNYNIYNNNKNAFLGKEYNKLQFKNTISYKEQLKQKKKKNRRKIFVSLGKIL